jgi:N-acetylmuramoyl-L-alanine amidase
MDKNSVKDFFLKVATILCFVCFYSFVLAKKESGQKMPVILIDPSGSANQPGRLIIENYERAETLKFAEELKKSLDKKYINLKNVVSREPGEQIQPLQISSLCNRMGAKFFLRIGMYHSESEKPSINIYFLQFDPLVDGYNQRTIKSALIPMQQAHFSNFKVTKSFAEKMFKNLSSERFNRYLECSKPIGAPIKDLIGITAPAIYIELGICREDKWNSLIDPIVESLCFIQTLTKQ